ncbi:hypothetical protein ACIA5C_22390 [Actinoplanes sp. NPDC051343]
MPAFSALPIWPYWSFEMFLTCTWMFGLFLFQSATTWSMPGTVFQY